MSINDVSDAFGDWLESYTAQRRTGSYVLGRWVPGSSTSVPFKGVVQNATPEDLQVIEEGMRATESIKIHTTTELLTEVENSQNGDLIPYNGDNYLVYNVAHRAIGNYHKAIAIKQ